MQVKLSKPARMFQWDTVDTSPDLMGQNVPPKLFKWLFDIKEAGHTNRIRESFLLLD